MYHRLFVGNIYRVSPIGNVQRGVTLMSENGKTRQQALMNMATPPY
jgi:hypothetical protein